jgi:co-chaperonin GroES (HSP10)
MKVPTNHYIISVPKEQKLGKYILAPVLKGSEVNELKPVLGTVVALPEKLTKDFGIASNTPFGGLNAQMLSASVSCVKQGDEVYLSYLACDEENYFDMDEDNYLYRVPVHHLIAIKKEGGFEAICGKVVIRPEMQAEFESKVLISVNNRKKVAQGFVVSCTDGMPQKFASGQRVAYMERLAEWIEIEGEKYDFVYTHEILGLL